MSFGNIGLLFGMLLGLIPIIIHLINRRRAKLLRFAAIEFLLLNDKRHARKLKLKQWLILALRVLLLAGLAFALAKPYIEPDEVAELSIHEPGAVVLLIDNSFSMSAKDRRGDSYLEKALLEAERLINDAGPETSFAIVTSGEPARALGKQCIYDRQELRRQLKRIDYVNGGGDLHGALKLSGTLLSQSGQSRRSLVILSDQAAHGFLGSPSWTFPPLTQVIFQELGKDHEALPNVAILDVTSQDPGAPNEEGKVSLTVLVKVGNFSSFEENLQVKLKLGESQVAELIKLDAHETHTLQFHFDADARARTGYVELTSDGEDAIEGDNRFFFTLGMSPNLEALLVNGSPRTVPFLDELFFLQAALLLPSPGQSPIRSESITVSELTTASLAGKDVLLLANVSELERTQILALQEFVSQGGGLFISLGDNWALEPQDIAERSGRLSELLPYPIRDIKKLGVFEDARTQINALSLTQIDLSHPIFSIFDGLKDASLYAAKTLSLAVLDNDGQESAKVIAQFDDGSPALVESQYHRGRVLLLTTSIDRDWSDLAIRTSFPPFIQRSLSYLARAMDQSGGQSFFIGEAIKSKIPEGSGPLILTAPDGQESTIEVEDEAGKAFLGLLDTPGHWSLMRPGERQKAIPFALNIPRSESNLELASDDTLDGLKEELTKDKGILPEIHQAELLEGEDTGEAGKTLLWPFILAGLFLLFGSEAWLLTQHQS